MWPDRIKRRGEKTIHRRREKIKKLKDLMTSLYLLFFYQLFCTGEKKKVDLIQCDFIEKRKKCLLSNYTSRAIGTSWIFPVHKRWAFKPMILIIYGKIQIYFCLEIKNFNLRKRNWLFLFFLNCTNSAVSPMTDRWNHTNNVISAVFGQINC